jgi:NADPH:quinone reductase-like Zn-dependent oxidoreductase
MRAVYIRRPGRPEVLEVRDVAAPTQGGNDLVIRVRAAGINFADVLARQGVYPDAPPYPCVVGYEVAGIVESAGKPALDHWIGKEVLALTDFGGYAELAACDANYVWEKPAGLSFETAASIPLNYITAWALLVASGRVGKGDTVLIHNAGGGVGLAAIDIARHFGATTIGTASARKHDFLKSRGLDHAIDYTRGDWVKEVRAITRGQGVNLAIDPLGGSSWKKSYSVLQATGRLGMFGISTAADGGGPFANLNLLKLAASTPLFHPFKIVTGNRGIFGVNIHSMYGEHEKFTAWMREILAGVAAGWARPHVDRIYKFDQAGEAHAWIEGRGNIGKVLLVP